MMHNKSKTKIQNKASLKNVNENIEYINLVHSGEDYFFYINAKYRGYTKIFFDP